VQVTSAKSGWVSGAKLCLGFVQAIPGGSWLPEVCFDHCCVFSFLQDFSICTAQRNQFLSVHYNVPFLDFCIVIFSCYSKLLFYSSSFV
jgi:hypothetical protein